MTADQKRARRKAKHTAMNLVAEGLNGFYRMGNFAGPRQIQRAAKVVVEKHLANIRRGRA